MSEIKRKMSQEEANAYIKHTLWSNAEYDKADCEGTVLDETIQRIKKMLDYMTWDAEGKARDGIKPTEKVTEFIEEHADHIIDATWEHVIDNFADDLDDQDVPEFRQRTSVYVFMDGKLIV